MLVKYLIFANKPSQSFRQLSVLSTLLKIFNHLNFIIQIPKLYFCNVCYHKVTSSLMIHCSYLYWLFSYLSFTHVITWTVLCRSVLTASHSDLLHKAVYKATAFWYPAVQWTATTAEHSWRSLYCRLSTICQSTAGKFHIFSVFQRLSWKSTANMYYYQDIE
jgi:hypothetical protein